MFALRAAARPSPALRAPTRAVSSEVLEAEMAKIRQGFAETGLNAATVSADKLKETFTARPDLVDAVTNVRKMMFQRNYSTSGLTYSTAKPPVRVTVTGASGAIGYAALFRIASGEMLGKDQPVILQLLELPGALKSLQGVAMELNDCAFPLLKGIVQTDNAEKAFEGAQYALLVGAKPRTKGMERADLLKGNAEIFKVQGKAINATADKNIKVVVVGNPANTNALITAHWAPSISPNNFSAMTRLDHNRALAQLSAKASAPVESIQKFAIWGNHSPTMYPDVTHATIGGKPLAGVINDQKWLQEVFIPVVQQRGTAIIEARGASSAASAAGSAIDHIRDWVHGTKGEWGSMGVISDGSYNTTPGLYFSFPLTTEGGKWKIVQGLKIDAFSEAKIAATNKELAAERDAVAAQLS